MSLSDISILLALNYLMEWNEDSHHDGKIVSLRLSGEIDLQHSPKLRELLQNKADAKTPALLLDFANVKYIDSSGLATLVEYYQSSRSYSGRIAMAAATERVKSVFDLVRLTEIFEFHATFDDALASLAGES